MKRRIMNGNEPSLDIILGKDKIANVSLSNEQLFWRYDSAWQNHGYAISPHLSLHGKIPPINVQRFMRNLLPEGSALEELLSCFHLSKSNTFALIQALGLDTAGSLVMLSTGQSLPHKGFFRPIPYDELAQRLDARDRTGLIIWDNKPRLSVAGVQDKINVIVNKDGQLGFGEGRLCSTHILKFETQKHSHLVLNEYMTMQLAKYCGLAVANVQLMYYGSNPALLVERFDRKLISMSEVRRQHVIDGCQALNLPPDYKYERNFGGTRDVAHIREGASYVKLFDFANQCANPALTKQKILDWVLFNLLVFNYDAHGKNISFFVGSQGISLAPYYDLVNVRMYPDFEQEMAMALGDKFDSHTVNAYQLADFADSCHLSRAYLGKRLKYLIEKLKGALEKNVELFLKNKSEKKYVEKYRVMIDRRCEHLLSQAGEISSIEL